MRPAMYIFVNKGLGMSAGKMAAQASHAAVEAYRLSCRRGDEGGGHLIETGLVNNWYRGGHYMKLVMEARDRDHLLDTERYLNDRGFKTALIIDEGHTEIEDITPTALGVEIVDKDQPHAVETFSSFALYTDEVPPLVFDHTEPLAERHPLTAVELERLKRYYSNDVSLDLSLLKQRPQRPRWFSRG